MLTGSLIIGFQMPEIPADVNITLDEASKLVVNRMNDHLKEFNVEPSRYTWLERNDVPDNPDAMPDYIRQCIKDTGIDHTKVSASATGVPVCCMWPTTIRYYYPFGLKWTGDPNSDPFTVKVIITDDWTMEIPLSCTVIAHQYTLRSVSASAGPPQVEFPGTLSPEKPGTS